MDKDQDKIASGKQGQPAACGPSPGPGCSAPEYAYKTIEEYEEIVGFKVGEPFRLGWTMARTTMVHLRQLATNSGGVMVEEPNPSRQPPAPGRG